MSACTKEGGCYVTDAVQITHGTESCGDRNKDVEPICQAGSTEDTNGDES